jgi:hypothetical protein
MQMDTNGQVLQKRIFKNDSSEIEINFNPFIKTDDGYFLLAARDNFDAILYKINDVGDTLWTKHYQADSLHFFRPYKIITNNNNYYLLLRTLDMTNNTQDRLRGTVIKIDSIGNELWRTEYTPTDFDQSADMKLIEEGNNLVLMGIKADGNYLINYSFKLQTQIRRIDSTGNIIGEYLSANDRWIGMWDGIQTQDGGFAFCGVEGTQLSIGGSPHMIYRGYVAKVDSNLQLVWERGFGKPDNTMHLKDIEELDDGSLILAGRRDIYFPEGVFYTQSDSGYGMGWILKMSAAGDSLWQRLYRKPFTNRNYLNDIEVLPDGGFIAAGYTQEYTPINSHYDYWGWLIRTDSFGCIVPGCQLLNNTENVAVVFDNEVTVFPNPASEVVKFKFEKPINENVEIRVYSGLGQLVGQITEVSGQANVNYSTDATMKVSDWHSGMYFYGVYVEGVLVKQGQILINH